MKKQYILGALFAFSLTACNDYLDRAPQSQVTPENYMNKEAHLEAYTANQYTTILSHSNAHGWGSMLTNDKDTDDRITDSESLIYAPGEIRVGDEGGAWNFNRIRECNYFFQEVLPRWEKQQIAGSKDKIKHFIGEMYFFRAYEYFKLLTQLGDLPILTTVPTMDQEWLVEHSTRSPRTEVVRFMLQDLDLAIDYMMEKAPDGNNNRLSQAVAQLFKSRVALYEATWLQNFAGTAFVPNGPGWPGAKVHSNYQFQAGSLESEVNWLLDQAMEASAAVADVIPLTPNTGELVQSPDDTPNPFFDMFCAEDLSGYDEIMMWRDYSSGLNMMHNSGTAAGTGNSFTGTTKGFVETFLMANGLPIYAASSGYAGDDELVDVAKDRDNRLTLFLKVPGQINKVFNPAENPQQYVVEGYPLLFHPSFAYVTGYCIRKYGTLDGAKATNSQSDYGCPLFRSAEAYLNYIEASYLRTNAIDGKADGYWRALRKRAFVNEDYTQTIAATNMAEEAKGDWGAYSAGNLVDPTLYNIRRERRCELMSEGFRLNDLKRWRSMDQMMQTPYIVEGFKLWGPMQEHYVGKGLIEAGNANANVSAKTDGAYLRPYRVNTSHINYAGYRWAMAHYLTPIAAKHFQVTGGEQSTIYQNPGWLTKPGSSAQ